MESSKKYLTWVLVPLGLFALYLHTLGPSLVPYRDAGEMATSVTHLGILHPPGYPMYSLLGHLWTRIPLANPAYRLNVLSAVALACAFGILLLLWQELWGPATALLTVGLGAVSYQFWTHALVSEMYTLDLLLLSLLLLLLQRKKFELAAFVLGVGVGIRIDIILCAPALLILFLARTEPARRRELLIRGLGFFALGASAYFYLLIRANCRPIINWGDPSTLDRFWASIIRRSYASTLDLLSKSYQSGENFLPEFRLYVLHLARDFSILGVILAALGLGHLWKNSRTWFGVLAAGWTLTGPLFIFLGNLPPNPHAVAIMEAAYLVPDLFFLFAVGAGLAFLQRFSKLYIPVCILTALVILAQAARFYPVVNKRDNWFAVDYAHNVLYSVPEPSLIVARSDVPVFSLFYGYWVYPGFHWRVPVAQGLSSAAWYQVMMDKQVRTLDLEAMYTAADWDTMAQGNTGWSLYGTQDADWPPDLYAHMVPSGLLLQWMPRGKASILSSDTLLQDLAIYRGTYRYNAHRDFFSPELIEAYAKAWMEWGKLLVRSHATDAAAQAFIHALALEPDMPYPAFQLGYIYFAQGKYPQADYYYHWAVDNFRTMDRQAQEWKSFATVREGVRRDEAQALAHWGVIRERMGSSDQAEAFYYQALDVDPECADARYNLAVIYWRQKRWSDVVQQLQALAASHPDDIRWRAYLPQALQHLKNGV